MNDIMNLQRLMRGDATECHSSLIFVIISLPRSPPFPFVSSMFSSLSIIFSPGRSRISLQDVQVKNNRVVLKHTYE